MAVSVLVSRELFSSQSHTSKVKHKNMSCKATSHSNLKCQGLLSFKKTVKQSWYYKWLIYTPPPLNLLMEITRKKLVLDNGHARKGLSWGWIVCSLKWDRILLNIHICVQVVPGGFFCLLLEHQAKCEHNVTNTRKLVLQLPSPKFSKEHMSASGRPVQISIVLACQTGRKAEGWSDKSGKGWLKLEVFLETHVETHLVSAIAGTHHS